MRNLWRRSSAVAAVAALLVAGCGGNESPSVSLPVIAKAGTKNGDSQTGPAGQALPSALRVQVTRDGVPAESVTVSWATNSGGSLTPSSQETDADGASTSSWTLGAGEGPQLATASISSGLNATVTFGATATAVTTGTIIQVLSADAQGTNRFAPANLVVPVGTKVTWQWVDPNVGHNVVPDDGSTPPQSGSLVGAPHSYAFIFNTLGVFHYHCLAHGAAGGVGMSGTVTVVAVAP